MNTKDTDVVAEYLHEVDLRLAGLPVLQRRELLADLAAHVATERTERNVQTEGELIEILERLGSPEVVAAAAYEEAGPHGPAPTTPVRPSKRRYWLAASIGAVLVLIMLAFCGTAFHAGPARSTVPVPAPTATVSAR